jgi:Protein of unknown function (DUF559)
MAPVCDMRAIAERANTQLGLIATGQLRALGISRQTERTLVARGALVRLSPGVLRLAGHAPSYQQQLLAAVLEAGDGAVVSHLAACRLWRFDGIRSRDVELSVPRSRRPRTVPGVVHRVRDLLAVDVGRRAVIPVTTPSRSLIDAAPLLTNEQIRDVVEHAARDRLIWPPYLRWRANELRRRGRPGASVILDLVADQPRRVVEETWLETRMLRLIADAELPPPRPQRRLRHSGGTARVDFVYDEARLVVEVDGHGTHSTRQERRADAERDVRVQIEGWRVAHFTRDDVVDRPDYVVGALRLLLGAPA